MHKGTQNLKTLNCHQTDLWMDAQKKVTGARIHNIQLIKQMGIWKGEGKEWTLQRKQWGEHLRRRWVSWKGDPTNKDHDFGAKPLIDLGLREKQNTEDFWVLTFWVES